jgi:hypothetical protein
VAIRTPLIDWIPALQMTAGGEGIPSPLGRSHPVMMR